MQIWENKENLKLKIWSKVKITSKLKFQKRKNWVKYK